MIFSLTTFRSIRTLMVLCASLSCPLLDWNIKFLYKNFFEVLRNTFEVF
jgi:hypothetical protein